MENRFNRVSIVLLITALLLQGCLVKREGSAVARGHVESIQLVKYIKAGHLVITNSANGRRERYETDVLTSYNDGIPGVSDKVTINYVESNGQRVATRIRHRDTGSYNKAASYRVIPSARSCSAEPQELLEGSGRITGNRVNIRNGPGTDCRRVGSISRGESFQILGKGWGWYYIDAPNRGKAWIYGGLVNAQTERADVPSEPLPPKERIRVAVVAFSNATPDAAKYNLGEVVLEKMTTALVNSNRFEMIERKQLKLLLDEMELGRTDITEDNKMVEIGKMLNARAIITGSVALVSEQISLDARIINVESGRIISAESKTSAYSLSNISAMSQSIVRRMSRKISSH